METEKTLSDIIVIWKDLKIERCEMEFSCGGDSMNDYSFIFYDNDDNEIEDDNLHDFFDDEVFNKVEFCEASDGHYLGEHGTVYITMNKDGSKFDYDKTSRSEWSENMEDTISIDLTPVEEKFIKEKILNLNGGDGETNINYKIDCIVTDEEEKISEELLTKIDEACKEHEFKDEEGEPDDFYRWSTNNENDEIDEIEIKDNKLYVNVSRSFTLEREE